VRVVVSQLPAVGVPVRVGADVPWAAHAVAGALEQPAGLAFHFDLRVDAAAGGARVHGDGEVAHDATCDRCGAPVRCTLGGAVDLLYVPDPGSDAESRDASGSAAAGERALSGDQLDVGFLEAGGILELGAALAEQVVLWAPMRILCTDEGVRPSSGAGCAPRPPAPGDAGPAPGRTRPFAGLRLPE